MAVWFQVKVRGHELSLQSIAIRLFCLFHKSAAPTAVAATADAACGAIDSVSVIMLSPLPYTLVDV